MDAGLLKKLKKVVLGCAALAAADFEAPAVWAQAPAPVLPPTAMAPIPPESYTFWKFLGIPQAYNKVQDAAINKKGNFPGMERKPPLMRLADPRNLYSQNPAIKAAAQVKMEEDLAEQKIKAIRYLATIGCGCYDKKIDPPVKAALMAALDDCTERVRYEAAKAIAEAACTKCANCSQNCCCGKEMTDKLSKIVYERDDHGCYLEQSERVRAAAREAMIVCCRSMRAPPGAYPVMPGDPGVPPEAPNQLVPPETVPTPQKPETVPGPAPTKQAAVEVDTLIESAVGDVSLPSIVPSEQTQRVLQSNRDETAPSEGDTSAVPTGAGELSPAQSIEASTSIRGAGPVFVSDGPALESAAVQTPAFAAPVLESIAPPPSQVAPATILYATQLEQPAPLAYSTVALSTEHSDAQSVPTAAVAPPAPATRTVTVRGKVVGLNAEARTIELVFPANVKPSVGMQVKVVHEFLLGNETVGVFRVTVAKGRTAVAVAPGISPLKHISLGDLAVAPYEEPIHEVAPSVPEAPVEPKTAAPVYVATTAPVTIPSMSAKVAPEPQDLLESDLVEAVPSQPAARVVEKVSTEAVSAPEPDDILQVSVEELIAPSATTKP